MNTAELQSELEKWKQAVTDSRKTIQWLEQRGDAKTTRIRELESKVRDLGGTP
jgi:chromosome segregation ATPase